MLPGLKDKIHAPFAEGGILSGLMAVIAIIYPVCALFSRQANDVLFWLLVVLSIGVIFCRKHKDYSFLRFLKDYWPLWFAMSLLFFAELSNQLFATRLRLSLLLSEPFRLVLLPLLVYGWLALPLEKLKQARWGWMLCAIAGGLFLFFISDMGKFRPNPWEYIDTATLVPFTNLFLITGFMAIFAIWWDKTRKNVNVMGGVFTLFMVMCGIYISQTRASWIIVLILFFITIVFFWRKSKKAVVAGSLIFIFSALAGFFMPHSPLMERVKLIHIDIDKYQKGNANTSIGARFQLWEASWMIFSKHPWTGVGGRTGQFRDAVKKTGLPLSHETARQPHAHNEIFQRGMRYGILGGIAVLAIFLVPFFYFLRRIHSSDTAMRTTAFMGVAYKLAFFVFGLTSVVFERRNTVQIYIVLLSVLLAILIKRERELLDNSEINQ